MAQEREIEKWVTINGKKVPIYKDNVKADTEYASDMTTDEKKKAENEAKRFEKTVEELTAQHNINDPDDDLEDYVWERIYDSFSLTLPDDMSNFVFDNNRGNYDENGKIGIMDIRLHSSDNKKIEMQLKMSYVWMDDFDDESLELMGIYK